jgi:hypothetical protein
MTRSARASSGGEIVRPGAIESSADRMADADQSSLFDFYDHLDLNRDVERELRHTDGGGGY